MVSCHWFLWSFCSCAEWSESTFSLRTFSLVPIALCPPFNISSFVCFQQLHTPKTLIIFNHIVSMWQKFAFTIIVSGREWDRQLDEIERKPVEKMRLNKNRNEIIDALTMNMEWPHTGYVGCFRDWLRAVLKHLCATVAVNHGIFILIPPPHTQTYRSWTAYFYPRTKNSSISFHHLSSWRWTT